MTHTGTFLRQQRRWSAVVFVTGVVLLVLVIWLWWHFVYSNPTRAFFGAIDNGLRTSGVSKQVTQEAPGQKLVQNVSVSLAPEHTAHSETTIIESSESATKVETETFGTPTEDYVRYTAIQTDQKSSAGEALDFSELLDIWGKSKSPDGKQTTGELYGETVLGVIPFGDLSAPERTELMKFIEDNKVFQFDQKKVKRQLRDGRPVYTYEVTIAPEPYVGMLKRLAKAVGLTQLEKIDPANYQDAQPMTVTITIDVWAREVASLSYGEGGRVEKLGSYGLNQDFTLPEKSIPVEELQQRLQTVQ